MISETETIPEAEVSSSTVIYVRGTAEQRAKNQPALDLFRRRLSEAASMTAAESAEVDRDWERFKQIMNEYGMSDRARYVD